MALLLWTSVALTSLAVGTSPSDGNGTWRLEYPPWGEPGTPVDGHPQFSIPLVIPLTNSGCSVSNYVAMRIAASHLNRRDATLCPAIADLQNLFEISYEIGDGAGTTFGCVRAAIDLDASAQARGSSLPVVIGAYSSGQSKAVSSFLMAFGVPQVAWYSTSAELSNKAMYPNFFRVTPPDSIASLVLVKMAQQLGFQRAGVIYFDADYQMALADDFMNNAAQEGLEAVPYRIPASGDNGAPISVANMVKAETVLAAIRESLCRVVAAMAINQEAANLWEAANRSDMITSEGWVWVSADGISGAQMDGTAARYQLFSGSVYVLSDSNTPRFKSLASLWETYMPSTEMTEFQSACAGIEPDCTKVSGFGWTTGVHDTKLQCTAFSGLAYDALVTVAVVIDRLMTSTGKRPEDMTVDDITAGLRKVINEPIECMTGTIQFDDNQDRLMQFALWNWQGGSSAVLVGRWNALTGFAWVVGETVTWPSGTSAPIVSATELPAVPSGLPPSCGAGFTFNVTQSLCVECSLGSSSRAGMMTCDTCVPGTFADERGLSQCKLCAPASFSGLEAVVCTDCPAGSANDQMGASECDLCYPGSAAPQGSMKCELCPRGLFATSYNSSECGRCAGLGEEFPLTTEFRGSTSADMCVCPTGSFAKGTRLNGTYTVVDASGEICSACLEAMDCPHGSAIENIATGMGPIPAAQLGHMTLPRDPLSVYRCFIPKQCPGGAPGSCATLADKVACGSCEDDTYRTDGICHPCGDQDSAPMVLFILTGVALAVTIAVVMNREMHKQRNDTTAVFVMLGIMLMSFQTIGLFSNLTADAIEPVRSILNIASLLSFDISFLRGGCLMGANPVRMYLLRQLACPCLAIVALGTLVMRVQKDNLLPQLINSLGYLVNVFVLPILISVLMPLICYSHPNGTASVVREPSILCFDSRHGDEHSQMLGIGFAALMFVPVPFLVMVVYATWQYPRWMNNRHNTATTMKAFRFLFVRFRPERYYYSLMQLTRNFLMVMVPVFIRDDVPCQVLIICCVIGTFLLAQQTMRPWGAAFNNACDGMINMCLLLMLVTGSMTTGLQASMDSIQIIWTIITLATIVLAIGATVTLVYYRLQPSPWYHIFLTHHKADAAAQARLLKMLIESSSSSKSVFLDSDNLDRLDLLFDTVKTKVGHLVAYLTRDTLRRPWCVGEVAIANLANVRISKVVCPSFLAPSSDDLLDLFDSSGNQESGHCNLGLYGITLELVMVHLEAVLKDDTNTIDYPIDNEGLEVFMALSAGIVGSAQAQKSLTRDETSEKGRKTTDGTVVVSADPDSDEALASAGILIEKIRETVHNITEHPINLLTARALDSEESLVPRPRLALGDAPRWQRKEDERAIERARCGIVILTPGSLNSSPQLQAICRLMWTRDVDTKTDGRLGSTLSKPILSQKQEFRYEVIALHCPGFIHPTRVYYQDSLARAWQYDLTSEVVTSIQDFFKIISMPFATNAMDQAINMQAMEVVKKIPQKYQARTSMPVNMTFMTSLRSTRHKEDEQADVGVQVDPDAFLDVGLEAPTCVPEAQRFLPMANVREAAG